MHVPADGAWIDPTGRYRYLLWRTVGRPDAGVCVFVMLNPSTADASLDDPTIRRCRSFATRIGCGRVEIVNLFAFRATKPVELPADPAEAVGPLNFEVLQDACSRAQAVIAGWGASVDTLRPAALRKSAKATVGVLREMVPQLHHLGGLTKDGHPRHPLYLAAKAPLNTYSDMSSPQHLRPEAPELAHLRQSR